MKKFIEKILILIIGIVIGLSFIFSYATSYNSEEITYDNSTSGSTKTNVKDAVDELYKKTKEKLCKRAIELHTQGVKTFGNESVRIGTLTSGDAFDCDVNDDGIYDEETERFYYITELASDNTKAVLLYYSNTSNGVATPSKTIAYNSSNANNQGPVKAKDDLPSTSQWKTTIYSNPRQITNENGGTTTSLGTIVSYNYGDRAARLITIQELRSACGRTDNMTSTGSLDTCTYTMENTKYADVSLPYGYWLETPRSSVDANVMNIAVSATYSVSSSHASSPTGWGVRPAIEVPKSDIAY